MKTIYDVIVIGGGAAGMSAGIYSGRAKMKTLVLEQGSVGGQAKTTNEIVNYPGVRHTTATFLAGTTPHSPLARAYTAP